MMVKGMLNDDGVWSLDFGLGGATALNPRSPNTCLAVYHSTSLSLWTGSGQNQLQHSSVLGIQGIRELENVFCKLRNGIC
jgi:hypothetical protein